MKFLKKHFVQLWVFLSIYKGWYIRHKNVYKKLRLIKLTENEKEIYKDYWGSVSSIVSLKTVEISKSLSGRFDKRIVPEEFFPLYFERMMNSDRSLAYLQNKSIYNKWFEIGLFPVDYFHKINGIYYTSKFEKINEIDQYIAQTMSNIVFPIVVKPNKDSYGGANVYFINNINDLLNTIESFQDLVVQEKIIQSNFLNLFNADSINTVRVCLYRDDLGCIYVLNTSLRMGKDGSLDNETAGGIVCNIKLNGMLNDYAVDKDANKYNMHPNSGFVFKNKEFPFYSKLIDTSLKVSEKIIGVNLISLDMALDMNNNWRCIEINLFGQTIRFSQYAGQPFFGDFTDQVINKLLEQREDGI